VTASGVPIPTLQIVPALANPGVTSGFVIADESTYTEHIAGGFVYTGETARRDEGGERKPKPSAQPTLVRTQYLPPPAKTVR
jgi:hypothetical protein